MVKFKLKNKGRITQGFSNANDIYKDRGGFHTGIDSVVGWNKPVTCDNDCLVYKIITSDISKENWQGVYMLVPHGDAFVEICQGHFNKILVKEGERILEHTVIGLEGNKGYVFQGGVQITPEMQRAGDQRGTHTHTSYRPVKRVKRVTSGEHYLLTSKNVKYQDKEGYYYEILAPGEMKGYVDPMIFEYENTMLEDLKMAAKVLLKLKKQYE
jgi:hypothetical protein